MKVKDTPIKGIKIITPEVYFDERGYFFEIFQADKFKQFGIESDFVQDNQSYSKYATIRGLHYQVGEFAQGKLVNIVKGKILDVIVDIRFGSPTFGKHFSIELSNQNQKLIWIPPGFAHGFSVLSESAIVIYKCTAKYSPKHERGIKYNDPKLMIDWRVDNPLVSKKDKVLPALNEIEQNFIYK